MNPRDRLTYGRLTAEGSAGYGFLPVKPYGNSLPFVVLFLELPGRVDQETLNVPRDASVSRL